MEDLLRELITINREMLSELRLLRQVLSRGPIPVGQAEAQAPASEPEFGLADAHKAAPPRFTPEDLEDIHGSLLEGLKKRNKDKSNAFSEFEKRHKNW